MLTSDSAFAKITLVVLVFVHTIHSGHFTDGLTAFALDGYGVLLSALHAGVNGSGVGVITSNFLFLPEEDWIILTSQESGRFQFCIHHGNKFYRCQGFGSDGLSSRRALEGAKGSSTSTFQVIVALNDCRILSNITGNGACIVCAYGDSTHIEAVRDRTTGFRAHDTACITGTRSNGTDVVTSNHICRCTGTNNTGCIGGNGADCTGIKAAGDSTGREVTCDTGAVLVAVQRTGVGAVCDRIAGAAAEDTACTSPVTLHPVNSDVNSGMEIGQGYKGTSAQNAACKCLSNTAFRIGQYDRTADSQILNGTVLAIAEQTRTGCGSICFIDNS